MTRQLRLLTATLAFLALLTPLALLAAQPKAPGPDSPEPAIRAFYRAVLSGDSAAFHKMIVADPQADRFLPRQPPTEEKKHEIDMESRDFTLRQLQPFRCQGKEVARGADGHFPAGTTTRYLGNFPSSLTVVSVVRQADGWKVDMRWWDAIAAMTEEGPAPGSPEYAVKSLTAALVMLRRDEAEKVIVPDGRLDLLFDGAPPHVEPSDQLISLVGEMPVVEIGPGEFVPMPSGRIEEGTRDASRKVLVGLFGPREVPFVVQKVGSEWKVAVEPYFTVIEW